MIPWVLCDRERAPNGGELTLHRHGDDFLIRIGSKDLMWSGSTHSEEEMARIAIGRLSDRPAPRVLVGGLGMGFTVRAALDALPADARVVVAEIVSAVVVWNRGPLAKLANSPLSDPRVEVELGDVARFIARTPVRFDAILLDVDNGPQGLTRNANDLLYGPVGLANARRALQPGGVLAVWSASAFPHFVTALQKAGFQADCVRVRARGEHGGAMHSLYFGQVAGFSPTPVRRTRRR